MLSQHPTSPFIRGFSPPLTPGSRSGSNWIPLGVAFKEELRLSQHELGQDDVAVQQRPEANIELDLLGLETCGPPYPNRCWTARRLRDAHAVVQPQFTEMRVILVLRPETAPAWFSISARTESDVTKI
jgi:hypothetical protein